MANRIVVKKQQGRAVTSSQASVQSARTTTQNTFTLQGAYARVLAISGPNQVDLELENGILLKYVPVRSLTWAAVEPLQGKRSIPPVDSRVFILIPAGVYENSFVVFGMFELISEEQAAEFFQADTENEAIELNAAGWKTTYNKETGDLTVESDADDANQIVFTVDRTNELVSVAVGDVSVVVDKGNNKVALDIAGLVSEFTDSQFSACGGNLTVDS
jgi:hypothetical protein